MMVVNAVKCFRYSVLSMIKRLMSLLLTVVVSAAASLYAQVEFKRGLEQISFVPKGQWITGVNVSFSQSNQDNYQFFIVEDINGDTYSYKISPMLMYCFKDNLAAGGKMTYTRTRTHLDNARVVVDSETDYTVENLYQISHNYSAMACFRKYIMVMFLNNYSAIEVNVGVLGFNYSHSSGTTDQIYDSSRHSKQANFKINLFSITFGVAFYL